MTTNLINIGRSGASAARASIELTAQNIANANNPDYVRRTQGQDELVGTARIDRVSTSSLNGVRIGSVQRADTEFIQRQVRVSGSDLARANAELSGLFDAETALEESRLFEGLVDFEASLSLLEGDPTDPALRTAAVETARQLADTFGNADFALGNARDFVSAQSTAGVDQINAFSQDIARLNVELVNAREGSAGHAALLDARDAALRDLSEEIGISVTFDDFGAAEVRIDASGNPLLVTGNTAGTLSKSNAADGSLLFNLDGTQFGANTGAMAGRSSALADITARQDDLDAIASSVITRSNAAQGSGSAQDGSAGQPLFSGLDAGTIALTLTDGSGLAVASSGAPAGSRDTGNLATLIAAIGGDDGPIAATDNTLLTLSSRIAGLNTTRDGLEIINSNAQAQMLSETGVDLDVEAANLIRLQQAFEANSRVIQVASNMFDTLLGLR